MITPKSVLLPDLVTIIHKMKTSMNINEVNQQILNINRNEYQADDLCRVAGGVFLDTHHNVRVIRYKNLKINPINLKYTTMRDLGFQWSYYCGDCGEFLTLNKETKENEENEEYIYSCKCYNYF